MFKNILNGKKNLPLAFDLSFGFGQVFEYSAKDRRERKRSCHQWLRITINSRIFPCNIAKQWYFRTCEDIRHRTHKLEWFVSIHDCHVLMLYDLGSGPKIVYKKILNCANFGFSFFIICILHLWITLNLAFLRNLAVYLLAFLHYWAFRIFHDYAISVIFELA